MKVIKKSLKKGEKQMDIREILSTKESKINFLKGLIRLAKVDGVVDDREFVFYKQVATVLELDNEEIDALEQVRNGIADLSIDFESDRQKMFFIVQAVQLCWIDNEYCAAEKQEIRKICREIGISEESLKIVEEWAYEGIEWNKRGEKLLELH